MALSLFDRRGRRCAWFQDEGVIQGQNSSDSQELQRFGHSSIIRLGFASERGRRGGGTLLAPTSTKGIDTLCLTCMQMVSQRPGYCRPRTSARVRSGTSPPQAIRLQVLDSVHHLYFICNVMDQGETTNYLSGRQAALAAICDSSVRNSFPMQSKVVCIVGHEDSSR